MRCKHRALGKSARSRGLACASDNPERSASNVAPSMSHQHRSPVTQAGNVSNRKYMHRSLSHAILHRRAVAPNRCRNGERQDKISASERVRLCERVYAWIYLELRRMLHHPPTVTPCTSGRCANQTSIKRVVPPAINVPARLPTTKPSLQGTASTRPFVLQCTARPPTADEDVNNQPLAVGGAY